MTDMTHYWYVWRESCDVTLHNVYFTRLIQLNESCKRVLSHDWHDSLLICVTWFMRRDSSQCVRYMTHSNVTWITCMWAMYECESCLLNMTLHSTYGWCKSCHIHMWRWFQWGDDTHTNESCHTYQWVMSHILISHVTHRNESWFQWVMTHILMSHVTRSNESWHTYLYGTYGWYKSCHTYQWVMSHILMSHVTHTNESCRTS